MKIYRPLPSYRNVPTKPTLGDLVAELAAKKRGFAEPRQDDASLRWKGVDIKINTNRRYMAGAKLFYEGAWAQISGSVDGKHFIIHADSGLGYNAKEMSLDVLAALDKAVSLFKAGEFTRA